MRRSRPGGTLLLAMAGTLACVAFAAGCAGNAGTTAAVGERAPEYRGVSLDGSSVSLGELRGAPVLLNVWSVWCLPCRAEIPALERLRQTYAAAGLRVIGVNVDARGDEETVRRFVRDGGIRYPVWLDPDDTVSKRFHADGLPASHLIGPDGTLLWSRIGVLRPGDPTLREALDAYRAG